MKNILNAISVFVLLLVGGGGARGAIWDCLWGGPNEETAYTRPYVPGMDGTTLKPAASPDMNLGAPPPGIPIQATPNTQATTVPQALLPTITTASGPVGTVGLPGTQPGSAPLPQAPPGTEILYVLPSQGPKPDECLDGVKGKPAVASTVVPAGTPGAIPVAVKTVSVVRPKVEYQWSYSPIRSKTETLVQVVDPRTRRVVRSYCRSDEDKTSLPWPHRKEVITYETVTAKVGTPISLPAASVTPAAPVAPVETPFRAGVPDTGRHGVQYPLWNPQTPTAESGVHTTVIVP